MPKMRSLIGLSACIAAVALGFWGLALYETRPGGGAAAPPGWPDRSRLTRDPDRPTLVMFLHPHCPCSRASLEELAGLHSTNAHDLRTFVVFCKPNGVPEGWEKTALWQQAIGMKGIDVFGDDRGEQRQLFGVQTSGQVLLFDREGRLRYSGGITRARGRAGANPGRSAIEAIVRGGSPSIRSGPVFGCPLVDPQSPDCKKGNPCPDQ
jgi:hypothetical protein